MANGTITSEQAALLGSLSTPHQQFAAITAFRSVPGRSLETVVEEIRKGSASPVSPPRKLRTRRWAPASAVALMGLCLARWSTHNLLVKKRHQGPNSGAGLEMRAQMPSPAAPVA